MNNKFQIDISKIKQDFQRNIDLEGNSRIVFSGPFGSGKTFFLKRFFENNDKYLCIHLYPTNYTVSKNEDIFELIKFDILYELLGQDLVLDKMEVTNSDVIPFLDGNEQVKILGHFFSMIPNAGKSIADVIENLKKIFETINEKKRKLKIDEGEKIQEFAEAIEQTKGSIYEKDFYSNMITDLIARLRKEKGKKVVLLIDDLDRIDPDHIFRLLNIFSSHLDLEKIEENKFGFDRVILCCDIENIRTIFHNKFGQDVDFSGYIDKFYSREVFEFNNSLLVSQSVDAILKSLIIDPEFKEVNGLSSSERTGFIYTKYLLISLIVSNVINLRVLLKLLGKPHLIRSHYLVYNGIKILSWQAVAPQVFDFLTDLFGDNRTLERALNKSKFSLKLPRSLGITEEYIAHFAGELILLADMENHKFRSTSPGDPPYHFIINEKKYYYSVSMYDPMNDRFRSYMTDEAGNRIYSTQNFDFKRILMAAYNIYKTSERIAS